MKSLFFMALFFSFGFSLQVRGNDFSTTAQFVKYYEQINLEMNLPQPSRVAKFYAPNQPQIISEKQMSSMAAQALNKLIDPTDLSKVETKRKLDFILENYDLYLLSLRFVNYYLPYQYDLESLITNDVRGYLYFHNNLDHLNNISNSETETHEALIQMCLVSGKSREKCQNEFETAYTNNTLLNFYRSLVAINQATYENIFSLDVAYLANDLILEGKTLILKMKSLANKDLEQKIKSLIEPHYKSKDWQLQIQFIDNYKKNEIVLTNGGLPHVKYERKYATLYLPQYIDLQDKQSQQILIHEFGHFLGLQDCYIEFYDSHHDYFVYYELDQKNLMCHLNGKITEESLTKIYNFFKR